MLVGEPGATIRALRDHVARGSPQRSGDGWLRLYRDAGDAVDRLLDRMHVGAKTLTEGQVVRVVCESAPADSVLMIGNSLPVRTIDATAKSARSALAVLSQRGASGIDGMIAGAAGASQQAGLPLTLLLGDVALLHDLTSLELAGRSRTPFVIVVIQNGGGRIFELLPIAKVADPRTLEFIVTPHRTDLEAAARAFHVEFCRVTSLAGLGPALQAAYGRGGATGGGATLLEAVVSAHGAGEDHASAVAQLDQALASSLAVYRGSS